MKSFRKTFISLLLTIMLLSGTVAYAASSFKDVKDTDWFAGAIKWGVENDITAGYPDGTFKPSGTVTEEEFYALVIRAYLGQDLKADVGEKWSDPYYKIVKDNKYPTTASRTTKITRTFVAELIAGTQGKNLSGNNAIRYLLNEGLSAGKTAATVTGYAGNDTLTRAEAIMFIQNVLAKADSKTLLPRPTTADVLPEVPLPANNAIGDVNPALAKEATAVHNAMLEYGYEGAYNGSIGGVFIRDSEGYVIMTYVDNSSEEDGTIVIQGSSLLGRDSKVVQEKLDAIVTALNTLGLAVDGELKKAMNDALTIADVEASIKYGDTTIEVFGVNSGRIVMYVEG